jgi:hypothetical protein
MNSIPSFVISCDADTGFSNHRLSRNGEEFNTGHLDNFVGVHTAGWSILPIWVEKLRIYYDPSQV